MRVLICGGRKFSNYKAISDWLADVMSACPVDVVIEGGAGGADALGKRAAFAFGLPVMTFSANWNFYGKLAGAKRNQTMLDFGKPNLVLAFPSPDSRGTWDMVRRAKDAGIEVRVYE